MYTKVRKAVSPQYEMAMTMPEDPEEYCMHNRFGKEHFHKCSYISMFKAFNKA